MSKKSKALHGVIQLFLILFLLLYLSPLFLVGINAFKSYQEIMTDVMSLPSAFTLDNIKNVFHDMKYPATFLNTLIATVIGTLGIIVIASMGGYKMARVNDPVPVLYAYSGKCSHHFTYQWENMGTCHYLLGAWCPNEYFPVSGLCQGHSPGTGRERTY